MGKIPTSIKAFPALYAAGSHVSDHTLARPTMPGPKRPRMTETPAPRNVEQP